MRTKSFMTLTQTSELEFFVERRLNYTFYQANFREVIIPLVGSVEVSSEGKRTAYNRGSVIFIAPDVRRRVTLRNEADEFLCLRVLDTKIKEIMDAFDEKSFPHFEGTKIFPTKLTLSQVQIIADAVESIHASAEEDRQIAVKKLAYAVISAVLPIREFNVGEGITNRALAVMHDARNVAFRLPDVAEKVGCSEEYLVRCFKKSGLETPNTVFKRIKLRYAKSLLASKKISVSEVASIVGFRSVGHFNKLYSAEFGVCPGSDKNR